MSPRPKVRTILNIFNDGGYTAVAIERALDRTVAHLKLLVADIVATSGSRDVIESFGSCTNSVLKKNGEQASASEMSIAHSTGDILCLLDAEDWFKPENLSTLIEANCANSATGVVYHRYQTTHREWLPIDLQPLRYELPSGWLIDSGSQQDGHVFVSKTSDLAMRHAGNGASQQ